jgi:hypothetical protein
MIANDIQLAKRFPTIFKPLLKAAMADSTTSPQDERHDHRRTSFVKHNEHLFQPQRTDESINFYDIQSTLD